MKTLILILLLTLSFSIPLFADDESHEYGSSEIHESGEYHHRSEHSRHYSSLPSKSLGDSTKLVPDYNTTAGTEHRKPKLQKMPVK